LSGSTTLAAGTVIYVCGDADLIWESIEEPLRSS
jgi:hypothetical protein